MRDGLGGFLFGNIDEEGRIDDEDLDDELKASLSSFVEKGFGTTSGVFNLTSLGIEETEARAEEIDELEDDVEGSHRENYIPDSITGPSDVRFTEFFSLGSDDHSGARFHLKRVRVKRRFVSNKSLYYSEDSLLFFKSLLYFPSASPITSKHRLLIAQIASGQPVTLMGRKRMPLSLKLLESAFADYSSSALFDVPVLDGPIENIDINLTSLHPVQVLQWENEIIWAEDERKTSKLAPLYSDVRVEPSLHTAAPHGQRIPPGHAYPVRPPLGVPPSRPLSGLPPTLTALATMAPAALSVLIAKQRRLSPSPQPSSTHGSFIRNPATRVPNVDLLTGDWLEQVIWDEAERPPSSYPAGLVITMNDPNLLLDTIDTESGGSKASKTEKSANKKPKKAGAAGAPGPNAPQGVNAKSSLIVNYSRPLEDRFNISSDKWYGIKPEVKKSAAEGGKAGSTARTSLQHSIPALKLLPPHFSTSKSKTELRAWHRPKLSLGSFPVNISFSMVKQRRKKSNNRVGQVIRNSKKLTLRDGSPYLIIEYVEEFPLLLQNPGMATHANLFYRKRSVKDPHLPTDPHALIRLLEPTDPSPLWTFGDVPMGQSLYVLCNNMYRAPLFPHSPPSTDFLLIRNTDKNGLSRYYLREFGPIFLAGQIFPLMEIYSPHSRKHNLFCRSRLQVAAHRLFQKDQSGDERRKLKVSRLAKAFPQFSDGSIRKWLKEYAESQRAGSESGTWLMKADAPVLAEDDLRSLVTPEMVCIYEAMLAGQQRLLDAGLINEASGEFEGDQEDMSVDDDVSSSQQHPIAQLSGIVAPWSLSAGFLNAINNNGMVRLDGPGDPSGRGELFSYVKGTPASLQVSKVTDDSSLADVFRKSRNNAELQSLFNQEKRRIWEAQVKALTSKDIPLASMIPSYTLPDGVHDQEVEEDKGHKLLIKRTTMVNGVQVEQTEELTDPRVIAVYLKQRRQFDVKRKRRANAVLAATASKQRKKRLREEQQALFGLEVGAESAFGQTPEQQLQAQKKKRKEVNVRCGACGAIGHMRTNRICPLFQGEEDESIAINEPAAVRVEGTKLSINAGALHRIVEQEKSFKFKIQLGSLPQKDGGEEKKRSPKKKKKTSQTDKFLSLHPERKDALVAFNDALVKIVDKLLAGPDSWPFHRPVSRRDYPHYYRMISKPVDLGSIRTAASKHTYLHAAELLARVQLMANNCLQFNRADHVFTTVAFRLLDMARDMCSSPEILELERTLHRLEPHDIVEDKNNDQDIDVLPNE